MTFLAPIAGALAAALGTGVVLLLYMLRLRRRPILVSSTLLWSRAVRDMEGNIPFQRISPTLLLWLHLLIVALLALALARPVLDDSIADGQRVYIVIDASASMNAIAGGRSGLETAKAQAVDRVRSLFDSGRAPSVSVIAAAAEPSVLVSGSTQKGRIIGAIESIQPTDQHGEIAGAIDLVQSLIDAQSAQEAKGETVAGGVAGGADEPGALVWLMSDGGSAKAEHIPLRGGGGVSVSPYQAGADLGNLGVVAIGAQRDRADPGLCRLFVRVERSSDAPRAAVLRVFEDDRLITSGAVSFEDDAGSASTTFELRLAAKAALRVELDSDDALETDDTAWIIIPDPDPIRITLVAPAGEADPILLDALGVIARSDVAVVDEEATVSDADLVVYDRVSPGALADAPTIGFSSLLPDQDRSDRLSEPGPGSRMISWDRSDPIIRDAGLGSVSYRRSVLLPDPGAGVRVLAQDARGAVLIERSIGAHRHLRTAFALHDSNWAVQVGMPIFLLNAIEQLLPGASGVGVARTTSEVVIVESAGPGEVSIGPFPRVGLYEAAQAGGEPIAVSLLDPGESAMRSRSNILIGSASLPDRGRFAGGARRELWRWFTLGAIVLVSLEWFIYAHRVRIV